MTAELHMMNYGISFTSLGRFFCYRAAWLDFVMTIKRHGKKQNT